MTSRGADEYSLRWQQGGGEEVGSTSMGEVVGEGEWKIAEIGRPKIEKAQLLF